MTDKSICRTGVTRTFPVLGVCWNMTQKYGPGKHENGVALFTTLKKLIGAYVEGIAHINVTPKVSAKISKDDVEAHVLGIIMVQQFSLRAGIKQFGDKATKSISKELQQIHDMGNYEPMDSDKMTTAQRVEAM